MTSTLEPDVMQAPPLLVVEDSNEDFEALQRFLEKSSLVIPLYRCKNGDQALAFLYRTGKYTDPDSAPRPGLILLDLNLPATDGREVLHRIKQDDNLKTIPVVVFTTSNNPKDIEICYRLGVNGYIIKPINFSQLKRCIQMILDYWFEITTLPHAFSAYLKDTKAFSWRGVNGYTIEPINFDQLKQRAQMMLEYWFEVRTLPNTARDRIFRGYFGM